MSIYLSVYLSVFLSIYLPIHKYVNLSIYLSTYLPIYLSIYPYTYITHLPDDCSLPVRQVVVQVRVQAIHWLVQDTLLYTQHLDR